MPTTIEQIPEGVIDLSPRQKIAFAQFLRESAKAAILSDAGSAWECGIQERIRAIDEGRIDGVSCEDVMYAAEQQLQPRATR